VVSGWWSAARVNQLKLEAYELGAKRLHAS